MTPCAAFTPQLWGGLLLCAALSACSHAPEHPSAPPQTSHSTSSGSSPTADSPDIHEWQGRMSLLVQSEPPQHLHAAFTLQGSPAQGSLSLSTPLGNALAQANWQPGSASLLQGSQQQHYASLADMLNQTNLSTLPITTLFAWLQGRAENADGWHVDLSQYAKGKINANRQYPLPTAEIKIVVDQY